MVFFNESDGDLDFKKASAEERSTWRRIYSDLITNFADEENDYFKVMRRSLAPLSVPNQGSR